MIYEQQHSVAQDGSYPIQAIRLSNASQGSRLSEKPPLEAVWQYGAWGNHDTAEPFVVSVLRAAAADGQEAAIWLPHEPVADRFAEEDQWARFLPVIHRAADSGEASTYLAPHSISVRRAALEGEKLSYVAGLVALTPNGTPLKDERNNFTKILHEGAHWRTVGAAAGNVATTASLVGGFTARTSRHFELARRVSREGLRALDVLPALASISHKKPTGILLAEHDGAFPARAVWQQLREAEFKGEVQTIPATHVSAFVNHRNGAAFYKLWARVAQQGATESVDTQP